MSSLSVFLARVFSRSARKRADSNARYPDASKAIEEFHIRLSQRIAAAQRAQHEGTQTSEYQEQAASG